MRTCKNKEEKIYKILKILGKIKYFYKKNRLKKKENLDNFTLFTSMKENSKEPDKSIFKYFDNLVQNFNKRTYL